MIISLRQIYALISKDEIAQIFSNETPACFMSAIMPLNTPVELVPGNIYFMKTSMLPCVLPKHDVAFVLIEDDERDLSGCELERIVLKKGANIEAIYDSVQTYIEKLAGEGYALEQLLNNLCSEKSVKEILDLSCDFLHNPLVLFASHGKSMLLLNSYIPDTLGKLDSPNYLDNSAENQQRLAMHYADSERMLASNCPVMFDIGANFKGERRIGTIVKDRDGVVCGGLVLYERIQEFVERDFIYVDIISKIIGSKVGKLLDKSYIKSMYEQQFSDLIKGRTDSQDRTWLKYLNGDKHQNFVLIVISFRKVNVRQRNTIESFFNMEVGNCLTVRNEQYLVLLFNPRDEKECKTFISIIESYLRKSSVSGGISENFTDIDNLRFYYNQAVKAEALGNKRTTEYRLHSYKELKYHILLNELPANIDLDAFVSSDFRCLQAYDTEKGTEYCKTLISYILCNGNRKKVCAQLNIHRNTLPQRLEKIEQILNKPINQNDFLFDIYFSDIIDSFNRYKYKC